MQKLVLAIAIALIYSNANSFEREYRLKWRTKNGVIVTRTICSEYEKKSTNYKACRNYAKQWFRKKCRDLDFAAKKTSNKKDRQKAKQYCKASKFYP